MGNCSITMFAAVRSLYKALSYWGLYTNQLAIPLRRWSETGKVHTTMLGMTWHDHKCDGLGTRIIPVHVCVFEY